MEPEIFIEIWDAAQNMSGKELADELVRIWAEHKDADSLEDLLGHDDVLDEAVQSRMDKPEEEDESNDD